MKNDYSSREPHFNPDRMPEDQFNPDVDLESSFDSKSIWKEKQDDNDVRERLFLFREEDYYEEGDDYFQYGGLVFMDEKEKGHFSFPCTFACPECPSEMELFPGIGIEGDSAFYWCSDCGLVSVLETRKHIVNAAVLMVSKCSVDEFEE